MTSEEISALRSSLATLIASGHLEDRMADRLSGFLITVCKAFCLDVPEISVADAGHAHVDIEARWRPELLTVQMRTDGRASWTSDGVDWHGFTWTDDGAEYVVGRGLEVRI